MSLPIRERIIRALKARTGAVRQLPTYDHADLPLTVIQAGEDSASENQYGMTNVTMPVGIARALNMSGVKGDAWHQTLNKALADLIVEVFTGGDDLGGLAKGMDYVSGTTDLLTEAAQGGGVAVTVNVRYAWVHGNPFSQDADSEFTDLSDDEEESEDET